MGTRGWWLSTAEAHVQMDLAGLVDGDVFDEQPGDPFAFADGRGWITTAREVGGGSADAGLVGVVKGDAAGGGSLVLVVGVVELCRVSFQSASRLSATRRLSGSTAR